MLIQSGRKVWKDHTEHQHGVECSDCKSGFWKMTGKAIEALGTKCCCGGDMVEFERDVTYTYLDYLECGCGSKDAEEQYSLGIYAGIFCEDCWNKSGFRKEGKEGYDYLDAGEYYSAKDY